MKMTTQLSPRHTSFSTHFYSTKKTTDRFYLNRILARKIREKRLICIPIDILSISNVISKHSRQEALLKCHTLQPKSLFASRAKQNDTHHKHWKEKKPCNFCAGISNSFKKTSVSLFLTQKSTRMQKKRKTHHIR